jgi:hypothetical protein
MQAGKLRKKMAKDTVKSTANTADIKPADVASERRSGARDRRVAAEDRRNAERVADDLSPRRDPERQDRRDTVVANRAAAR